MNRPAHGSVVSRVHLTVIAALAVLLAAGCAALPPATVPVKPETNSAAQRSLRKQQVTQEFEARRDAAELRAAATAYEQGDLRQCRLALERLLGRNPRNLEARLLLVEVHLAANDLAKARAAAEELAQHAPGDPRVQFAMGGVLEAEGRSADAAVYYGHALQQDPTNEVYQASYQTASATSGSGARPSAAVAGKTGAAGAAGGTGAAGGAGRADPAETAAIGARFAAAEKALAAGSVPAAESALRQAIAMRPRDGQLAVSAAVFSLRQNQPDLAIRLLADAARAAPQCAAIHRTLGAAYYRKGDYKTAQLALQQALSLDKSSALSYFLLGCTLAKLGQDEAAGAHFRQAQLIDPRYSIQR